MNAPIDFRMNQASATQVADHLRMCDADFVPSLGTRVDLEAYALKITANATRFEAWSGAELVGLVAAYDNNLASGVAHITSVSVLRTMTGQGVASRLVRECIGHVRSLGIGRIELQVADANSTAVALYRKFNFANAAVREPLIEMYLDLTNRSPHEQAA